MNPKYGDTFEDVNGAGEWEGGKIYDPESGKTYSCNLSFTEDKTESYGTDFSIINDRPGFSCFCII